MSNYNGKHLYLNKKEISLDHTIQKVVEFSDQVIVLIYDDIIFTNNVIAFDFKGKELWRINDVLEIKNPKGNVDIKKEDDNILLVTSSLGFIYKIDINTKKMVDKLFLR
ncbi:MAG: hypothetical protein U0L42_00835 [Methanobrevibacter sp.]|jgi:2',3'-cyclic-nucleotide 2'-phosphodiesterase (5'-nucleotidase family)|uniref:hypothetical protein n=1 Tax=Methanobrevibacter sp. TaxID=66852 RepID=UPI002E776EB5|nr:hypothetical protein [Methanobrevibacter sp.]MEE0934196.1 hypothetical protein [Methanobrevibacter sp.]